MNDFMELNNLNAADEEREHLSDQGDSIGEKLPGKMYFSKESREVFIKEIGCIERKLKHICLHSPDGFNWGYNGSGPADLALSILCDYAPAIALNNYLRFKRDIISAKPIDRQFILTGDEIVAWIKKEGIK